VLSRLIAIREAAGLEPDEAVEIEVAEECLRLAHGRSSLVQSVISRYEQQVRVGGQILPDRSLRYVVSVFGDLVAEELRYEAECRELDRQAGISSEEAARIAEEEGLTEFYGQFEDQVVHVGGGVEP